MKVFFSWQNDDPHQRHLLMRCLAKATHECGAEFDHDTDRCAGAAPIAETILKKIEESDVFIGDVTPYNKVGEERLPNPNVMMEVGYAAHAMENSWERIILLINTEIAEPDVLPFNIRHLRISTSKGGEREEKLVERFAHYIETGLKAAKGEEPIETRKFTPKPEIAGKGCFFSSGTELVPGATMQSEGLAYLRLYPEAEVNPIRSELVAQTLANAALKPLSRREDLNGWSARRNLFGAICCGTCAVEHELTSITQLFLSKELWGINSKWVNKSALEEHLQRFEKLGFPRPASSPFIPSGVVEAMFTETLENYLAFAKNQLNLPLPLKIVAGVSGIEEMKIAIPPSNVVGEALRNDLEWAGEIASFETSSQELLRPFFELFWENCGVYRPGGR